MSGTKGKSGGKRSKSGPQKKVLSEAQVKKMLSVARKRAKVEGKTIDEVLLDVAYNITRDKDGNKVGPMAADAKDRLAAIKLFKTFTMVKAGGEGGGININNPKGPVIFEAPIGLPETKPDPALETVEEEDKG